MRAGKCNAFGRYGYRFSRGRREGLVFPICCAEMLNGVGVVEGELSAVIMDNQECRFGFFDIKNDRFMDMKVVEDPDTKGNYFIERDFKGLSSRRRNEDEPELILGVEFEPSSQLRDFLGAEGNLSIPQIIKYAADLLEGAVYEDNYRVQGKAMSV